MPGIGWRFTSESDSPPLKELAADTEVRTNQGGKHGGPCTACWRRERAAALPRAGRGTQSGRPGLVTPLALAQSLQTE